VKVAGAGWASVNGPFVRTSAAVTPKGFASVCVGQGWAGPGMYYSPRHTRMMPISSRWNKHSECVR
jgi:hypothetical protein